MSWLGQMASEIPSALSSIAGSAGSAASAAAPAAGLSASQLSSLPGWLDPSVVQGFGPGGGGSLSGVLGSLGAGAKNLFGGNNSLVNSLAGPLTGGLLGGGGGQSVPMQFPTLQHPQGQPVTPVTSPSVGNAGPLNSGVGLNPQLMRLIQMLSGGGGGLG